MFDPSLSGSILRNYEALLRNTGDVQLIADLAQDLAASGTRRAMALDAADIASTGGPSSLSTLLCPLHLVAAGLTVPKIAVPGRPAGGIDVLGSIEGYSASLTASQFENVLASSHYAHAIADRNWAPADAQLFRFRQEQGTQAVPALAVASLLAKKLAGGVNVAGLEARVADHGNFGSTTSEARRNADLYCEVASKLGMTPVVLLTDARVPFQPHLGRGEALTALTTVLRGDTSDPWLASHAQLCAKMSAIVSRIVLTPDEPQTELTRQDLRGILESHLRAQGSSMERLDLKVSDVISQDRTTIYATRDGFVHYDLRSIRDLLVTTQTGTKGPHRGYPNLSGLHLLATPWIDIRKGDPVLEFRTQEKVEESVLLRLFSIGPTPSSDPNAILEVVGP